MVPVMVLFLLFVQSFHYIAVQIVYLKITLLYVPNYIRVIVSLGMTNLTFYCTGTGTDGLPAQIALVCLGLLAANADWWLPMFAMCIGYASCACTCPLTKQPPSMLETEITIYKKL